MYDAEREKMSLLLYSNNEGPDLRMRAQSTHDLCWPLSEKTDTVGYIRLITKQIKYNIFL